ncbi:unnamed protein product [Enterobius vermicularis]|uniref:NTR domain-containing protein n=1 Tax=Enterobius vermicularis TaxID=51028 RepID=A0A0N4VIR8_ENTVE|nr:unnamed protein product [Enterobius vermicularis]
MILYNGTHTPKRKLSHSGDRVFYRLIGPSCNSRAIEVRAYPADASGAALSKYQLSAGVVDGIGKMTYVVRDGIFGPYPRMKDRLGVLCGFGDCGRGR